MAVKAETTIAASPEAVCNVVTDVTRIGEFSPECRVERIDGAAGAAVGARFAGTNRMGEFEWTLAQTAGLG